MISLVNSLLLSATLLPIPMSPHFIKTDLHSLLASKHSLSTEKLLAKLKAGGDVAGNGDDSGTEVSIDFICKSPANAEVNVELYILQDVGDPDQNFLFDLPSQSLFRVGFRRTPIGADETITFKYFSSDAELIITIDPDLNPVRGKVYKARWNEVQDLDCLVP